MFITSFELDLKIFKRPITKRVVYNFKRVDWTGLKETLKIIPWDLCFIPGDVDLSLENWNDIFLSAARAIMIMVLAAVNDHVPE